MNRRHELPRRIDLPEVGYFRVRLVRKGPWVSAEIRHDARTGWKAFIGGESCGFANHDPAVADGVYRIWSYGVRLTAAEFKALKRPTSPNLAVDPNAEPPAF